MLWEKARGKLHAVLNNSRKQHLIWQTIQVRQIRYAGHCWRNRGKLTSDVLQCSLRHGHNSVGRPAKTYIYQLWVDTGCSLADLSRAMQWPIGINGEGVNRICSISVAWWWRWLWSYTGMYMCVFGLVWFYGISTIVGYLTPNPFLSVSTVFFKNSV